MNARKAGREHHQEQAQVPGIPIALRIITARIPRRARNRMDQKSTDIEVEVVEIDGVTQIAPEAHADHTPPRRDWQDWRQWRGQVRRLDSRWWPLWVILGFVALALFLTVGLVIIVVFLIVSLLMKMLRAILR